MFVLPYLYSELASSFLLLKHTVYRQTRIRFKPPRPRLVPGSSFRTAQSRDRNNGAGVTRACSVANVRVHCAGLSLTLR